MSVKREGRKSKCRVARRARKLMPYVGGKMLLVQRLLDWPARSRVELRF